MHSPTHPCHRCHPCSPHLRVRTPAAQHGLDRAAGVGHPRCRARLRRLLHPGISYTPAPADACTPAIAPLPNLDAPS
eukprot:5087910-Pleurochrysis_carterae.AAC.2